MRNILVIPSNCIGDTIQLSGSIDHIRTRYPEAHIHLALNSTKMALFATFPEPFTVIPFDRQRFNRHWWDLFNRARGIAWDGILDLRCSIMGLVLRYKTIWTLPRLRDDMHVSDLSRLMFDNAPLPKVWLAPPKKYERNLMSRQTFWIVFCMAANQKSRSWPWERFLEVAQQMLASDSRIGIVFLAAEHTRAEISISQMAELKHTYAERVIDAVGTYPLDVVTGFMQLSDLVLTVDSGPLHMAAVIDKPVIALFGPTQESMTGPIRQNADSEHHFIRSAPFLSRDARGKMDHDSYSLQMLAIDADNVFQKVRDVAKRLMSAKETTND